VLVLADVMRGSFELKTRMLPTSVTWREMFSDHGGYFVFLRVVVIVDHAVNARLGHCITRFVDRTRGHLSAPSERPLRENRQTSILRHAAQ
jgi:hypothetical protein